MADPLVARARLDLILAHHPTLAQRFRGDDAHARVHPSWVQALLAADLVHGIRDIDAFIWRMRKDRDQWQRTVFGAGAQP